MISKRKQQVCGIVGNRQPLFLLRWRKITRFAPDKTAVLSSLTPKRTLNSPGFASPFHRWKLQCHPPSNRLCEKFRKQQKVAAQESAFLFLHRAWLRGWFGPPIIDSLVQSRAAKVPSWTQLGQSKPFLIFGNDVNPARLPARSRMTESSPGVDSPGTDNRLIHSVHGWAGPCSRINRLPELVRCTTHKSGIDLKASRANYCRYLPVFSRYVNRCAHVRTFLVAAHGAECCQIIYIRVQQMGSWLAGTWSASVHGLIEEPQTSFA